MEHSLLDITISAVAEMKGESPNDVLDEVFASYGGRNPENIHTLTTTYSLDEATTITLPENPRNVLGNAYSRLRNAEPKEGSDIALAALIAYATPDNQGRGVVQGTEETPKFYEIQGIADLVSAMRGVDKSNLSDIQGRVARILTGENAGIANDVARLVREFYGANPIDVLVEYHGQHFEQEGMDLFETNSPRSTKPANSYVEKAS